MVQGPARGIFGKDRQAGCPGCLRVAWPRNDRLAHASAAHALAKNIWFVGILDEKLDDFNRKVFSPQIDGSKTGLELPGIVDQVITMAEIAGADGQPERAFFCQTLNPFGFPAKDRSGRLDMIEVPHLGQLMAKIHGPVRPAAARLTYAATVEGPPVAAAANPSQAN